MLTVTGPALANNIGCRFNTKRMKTTARAY